MKLIPSFAVPSWASDFRLVTSVCDACQRSVTARHHSAVSIGIRMHEGWYCGARCFTAAARKVLTGLVAGSEGPRRTERMPLGTLLVSRGHITKQQLREVSNAQKECGGDIGVLLVGRGLASEKQVAAARAAQWSCSLFALPERGADSKIRLPAALTRLYSALALHYSEASNQLLVGFVESVDYGLLYAIEQIVGSKTLPGFMTPGDFTAQLKIQQQLPSQEALTNEVAAQPGEIALALCQAALESEAHECVITRCKSYIWARIKRDEQSTDLLFRTELNRRS